MGSSNIGDLLILTRGARGRIVKVNANSLVEWSRDLDAAKIRGMDLSTNGVIVIGWNRWPSNVAAQIAVLGHDGVVKSIEDVSFGTGPEGTAFLVDLVAGTPGVFSIIVQWENVKFTGEDI